MQGSKELDYEIIGESIQLVEVALETHETVIAEAGALMYLEDGIVFETKMGDGSAPNSGLMDKLFSAGKRMLTGESIFITHFTNKDSHKKKVAFAAPYPGHIVPLDLKQLGGEITLQKDCFLAATVGTEINLKFNKKLGVGFFGGEGFILQSLRGDGTVFVHAGGTVIRKELNGESLRVDTGCLVGFTQGIHYDIQSAGSFKTMMFGGEGLFLATLQGHGSVWLHSLPFSRLADRIIGHAPSAGGSTQGESYLMGRLGRILGGDR